MSAFAVTLCILASVSFAAVATISLIIYVVKIGWHQERHCSICAALIAHCFIERAALELTFVVCTRCFHSARWPQRFTDRIDADFESSPAPGVLGGPGRT
jgi:hypothetical protein